VHAGFPGCLRVGHEMGLQLHEMNMRSHAYNDVSNAMQSPGV